MATAVSNHSSHLAHVFAQYPFEVVRADGCWLEGQDGRRQGAIGLESHQQDAAVRQSGGNVAPYAMQSAGGRGGRQAHQRALG